MWLHIKQNCLESERHFKVGFKLWQWGVLFMFLGWLIPRMRLKMVSSLLPIVLHIFLKRACATGNNNCGPATWRLASWSLTCNEIRIAFMVYFVDILVQIFCSGKSMKNFPSGVKSDVDNVNDRLHVTDRLQTAVEIKGEM